MEEQTILSRGTKIKNKLKGERLAEGLRNKGGRRGLGGGYRPDGDREIR